jgi:cellulose biosynthesis protein BcsQ
MNSANQNKQALYIAICTQKGGAGKSVFTTLVASYLHYVKNYDVAVIDCDYPQWSIYKMRGREAEQLKNNAFYANKAEAFFAKLGKATYPIVPAQPETGLEQAGDFLASEEQTYDIVFFDLPGTVNNENIVQTYFAMDYLFVPVTTSRINMESTLPFIILVNETITINRGNIKLKGIHPFWNMVSAKEKQELYNYNQRTILEL